MRIARQRPPSEFHKQSLLLEISVQNFKNGEKTNLKHNNHSQNCPEIPIFERPSEEIDLIVDFPAAEEIEELQQHKEVEDHREMSRITPILKPQN